MNIPLSRLRTLSPLQVRSKLIIFQDIELSTNDLNSSFFITNDHWAYPIKWFGLPRYFQLLFGPFKWASGVVHCSEVNGKLDCQQVSPKNGHPSANGMVLVDDGKTLFVNDIVEATTTIYDVDPTSKKLTVKKKVVRVVQVSLWEHTLTFS
jgi:hypothetical protein